MATKVKKKAPAEVDALKGQAKGVPGRKVPDGLTGVTALAKELGIGAAAIRRRLRAAKVETTDGVYAWKGRDLERVKKLLKGD